MAAVAVIAVGGLTYALAQLRTCDEVAQVRRDSYQYRLCNVDREFIATMPVVAPVDQPRYSWKYADGMKPGRWRLEYQSQSAPAEVLGAVQTVLEKAGFSAQRGDAMRKELGEEYQWWFDGHSAVGLALASGTGRAGTSVDVLHDTGHE